MTPIDNGRKVAMPDWRQGEERLDAKSPVAAKAIGFRIRISCRGECWVWLEMV